MARVNWEIEGPAINNCNCDYGCPCQFNALPTHGNCHAIGAMHIDKGHFADTDLSGLNWATTFKWPGAVHMGNGSCQVFIDERANEDQRQALLTILSGQEAAEGLSVFQVFSTTLTEVHEPQFVPMDIEIDIENRRGHVRVPGVIDARMDAIRNKVTGEAQRVSVNMPGGFEYKFAEYASGTTKTQNAVALEFTDSHAHFCTYHFTQDGIVG